jgi:hypothetical protein
MSSAIFLGVFFNNLERLSARGVEASPSLSLWTDLDHWIVAYAE